MSADAVSFQNAVFGAGVGPIHINNVNCRGDEDNLSECSHSSALSCYRGHSEDAGVRCQGIVHAHYRILLSSILWLFFL